jgi:outer membrane biosynthesis protein TonB
MSKDVKKMVGEIRGALDKYPREQLQEILAYVFKEYVVEGSPASATGALAMLDARTELEGLSFAELVTWLQLHLDLPELALFDVTGGRVQVRAGGRAIALEAPRVAEPPPVQPQPPSVQATAVQSTPLQVSPASTPQPMPPQPRANPTPASTPQPMPPPIAPTPSHQAPPAAPLNQAPAPPAAAQDKDKQDEAAAAPANRFSWLEVD